MLLVCFWGSFCLFVFVILVPFSPNLALWWHLKLWYAIIEPVSFGLREAPGSPILLHQTKHQSMLWADQKCCCWGMGMITWLCESTRQRRWRFSERLHGFNVLSSFCIHYLTWTSFPAQWLIWSEFILWVAVMTSNLIGCLAGWKKILDKKNLDMETRVPHAWATVTFVS